MLKDATPVEHEELGRKMATSLITANRNYNRGPAISVVVREYKAIIDGAIWDPEVLRAAITRAWAGHRYPPTHLLDDVFARLARN